MCVRTRIPSVVYTRVLFPVWPTWQWPATNQQIGSHSLASYHYHLLYCICMLLRVYESMYVCIAVLGRACERVYVRYTAVRIRRGENTPRGEQGDVGPSSARLGSARLAEERLDEQVVPRLVLGALERRAGAVSRCKGRRDWGASRGCSAPAGRRQPTAGSRWTTAPAYVVITARVSCNARSTCYRTGQPTVVHL